MTTPQLPSKVIWFTGLSGAGKTTLARKVHEHFTKNGVRSVVLDGDEVRKTLSKDLGFSNADRRENVRRVANVAREYIESGTVVLSALISPFETDRALAMEIIGRPNFVEVFVDCALDVCEQRDVKGLYKKARAGEIDNFTGISSPYERPLSPDIIINTDHTDVTQSANNLIDQVLLILYTK